MKKIAIMLLLTFFISCGDENDQKVVQTIKGKATYYGEFFHGKKTKSGEIFDMNKLTAAHASLEMGTMVRVTNLENNKSIIVKINDEPRTNRKTFIDLSKEAFSQISHIDSGVVDVKIEVLASVEEE